MRLITGIRTCYVPAEDVPAMRQFYEETLGLSLRFADEDHWVQYGLKGTDFAIAGPRETPSGPPGHVVVFDVSDMAALVERLEATGQTPDIRDMGGHGKVLTVFDPAGQPVQFFARNAPGPEE
ncbi:VOC family protein [Poseidonocella sp. HB161398]|uniref:VOC family protein n=1 Tax=Poseidonocella sp. HB161398 TaxID=2320855 RepID=UPI001108690B|nr:VOC family protein [Poseidonocella sp. HB161398]